MMNAKPRAFSRAGFDGRLGGKSRRHQSCPDRAVDARDLGVCYYGCRDSTVQFGWTPGHFVALHPAKGYGWRSDHTYLAFRFQLLNLRAVRAYGTLGHENAQTCSANRRINSRKLGPWLRFAKTGTVGLVPTIVPSKTNRCAQWVRFCETLATLDKPLNSRHFHQIGFVSQNSRGAVGGFVLANRSCRHFPVNAMPLPGVKQSRGSILPAACRPNCVFEPISQ